jgi:hypothetical protein
MARRELKMSKFEEMCAAFTKSQKAEDAYKQRCLHNLGRLFQGFSVYCDFPNGTLKVVPLDKEIDEKMNYFIPGAAHETEDGFWHVGLWITISETPMRWATLVIDLSVAEVDGKVVVKIAEKDSPRPIDLGDTHQCNEFYERLVKMISNVLVGRPRSGKPSDANPIGFRIGRDPLLDAA